MAVACTLQPWGAATPRALRASAPRTTAASSSLSVGARQTGTHRLHQFSSATQPALHQRLAAAARARSSGPRRRAPAPPPRAQQGGAERKQPAQEQPAAAAGAGATSAGGAVLGSLGLWLLWGGLVAYVFFIGPNQTPIRCAARGWGGLLGCSGACAGAAPQLCQPLRRPSSKHERDRASMGSNPRA